MVLSGIAMLIYDSRIVQRYFTKIKNRFHRNRHEPQIELGTIDSTPEETTPQDSEPGTVQAPESMRVDPASDANPATGVNSPQASRIEPAKVESETSSRSPTQPVRADEVALPYSISVGLCLFCFFLISFIVIMVVRGVVDNLPSDFRFFANIYLAGATHVQNKLTY